VISHVFKAHQFLDSRSTLQEDRHHKAIQRGQELFDGDHNIGSAQKELMKDRIFE
jgi:hypothetical protein